MTKIDLKTGFIGAGNMGEAFTGALVKSGIIQPSDVFLGDVNEERLKVLKEAYSINTLNDNSMLFSECDIVVLAVKPQIMPQILSELETYIEKHPPERRKLIISIAAGITMKKIEDALYSKIDESIAQNMPVIRVMPNTPALVLSGMSGMCANRYASEDDLEITRDILKTIGDVVEVEEEEMDAVTAVSGSGPAYVFYLIESMIEAGISIGLEPEAASILTQKTIKGAIKLIEEKKESPVDLRRKVTSPGGTTEAAFKVLENNRVKDIIIEAITAAANRSKELSG